MDKRKYLKKLIIHKQNSPLPMMIPRLERSYAVDRSWSNKYMWKFIESLKILRMNKKIDDMMTVYELFRRKISTDLIIKITLFLFEIDCMILKKMIN